MQGSGIGYTESIAKNKLEAWLIIDKLATRYTSIIVCF